MSVDCCPSDRKDASLSSIMASFSSHSTNGKLKPEINVTFEHIPDLILDLESAVETSVRRPLRALRMLYALSVKSVDNCDDGEFVCNRVKMVHCFNQNNQSIPSEVQRPLVPALLGFLKRCKVNSTEHKLTLLVLNSLSVPIENKRIIALEHGGATLLGRLLLEDPSCHLLAIVIANLTFTSIDRTDSLTLRKDGHWTAPAELVESLAFALRVASLTPEEYTARIGVIEGHNSEQANTAAHRLAILMAEDQNLRIQPESLEQDRFYRNVITSRSHQRFPEMTRWCLAALRNLTAAGQNKDAACVLIRSSTISIILQFISGMVVKSMRAPSIWGCRSTQDISLSIVLNLSACSSSREHMCEESTIMTLAKVAQFSGHLLSGGSPAEDENRLSRFLCFKARMALSYLLGSQGHFGQSHLRPSASTISANAKSSPIVMTKGEIDLLLELLDKALQRRLKFGPGVKDILLAVRCLLTHTSNQCAIAKRIGSSMNALLIKALASHVLQPVESLLDKESAEYACFSLYMQSNHAFELLPFLPTNFEACVINKKASAKDVTTKVLSDYLSNADIRSSARHAARQLLLRLSFLKYDDGSTICSSVNLKWEASLLEYFAAAPVEALPHGAKPISDIFHRPIIQTKIHLNNKGEASTFESTSVAVFCSALQAVQQLSFGSTKVRHVGAIDEIRMANQIASCANGQQGESYNFSWTWSDFEGGVSSSLNLDNSSRKETIAPLRNSWKQIGRSKKHPNPFFRFSCGICSADTTVA